MSRGKRSYESTLCDDAHMMGSPHRGPVAHNSASSPCAQQHQAAASSSPAAAASSFASQHAPQHQPLHPHQPQQPQSTASLFRLHRLVPEASGAAASMTGFESRAHAPPPSLFSLDGGASMASPPPPARAAASSAASSSSSSSSAAHTPFFSSSSSSSASPAAAAASAASSLSAGCLSKRSRRAGAADVSAMCDESQQSPSPSPASSSSSSLHAHTADDEEETTTGANGTIHASPFAKLKRVHIDEVLSIPRSYKKQAIAAALAGPSSLHHGPIAASPHIPPPPSSTPHTSGLASYHHQLFTYDQVASIVRNAVEMREAAIRAEYDATLARLLAEQFESFSNFNKDYISRSFQTSDDHENSIYS